MSNDQQQNTNPNEELAAIIGQALVDAGLIAPSRLREVTDNVAAGTAKESDWRFWIELDISDRQERTDG